ncbi:hypothetical protein E2C01_045551 [Portunus trituberculatus]|uniref:Uncharacterized protein n=1 Tax=Portunus trituberculatus TaxID=210409 RepID=A0A5B7G2D4_PORTR|nr:hypothetical protein [Portunus trituberculatus]
MWVSLGAGQCGGGRPCGFSSGGRAASVIITVSEARAPKLAGVARNLPPAPASPPWSTCLALRHLKISPPLLRHNKLPLSISSHTLHAHIVKLTMEVSKIFFCAVYQPHLR